jgi:hypothetical protein
MQQSCETGKHNRMSGVRPCAREGVPLSNSNEKRAPGALDRGAHRMKAWQDGDAFGSVHDSRRPRRTLSHERCVGHRASAPGGATAAVESGLDLRLSLARSYLLLSSPTETN